MKILFLSDAVSEDLPGGSRVAARELALGLVGRGHSVTFLVPRHLPDSLADDRSGPYRIVRYEGAGRFMPFLESGMKACARLWSEDPFDIVHTHFAYASTGPLSAVPRHVPRIRTFHGPWDEEAWVDETQTPGASAHVKAGIKRVFRYSIERGSMHSSARVLALSGCFAGMAAQRYGVDRSRIRVIAGGADIERFRPAGCKYVVRRHLGLPPDRRVLLTVRRLESRMGLDNLIQAMPQVLAKHPDTMLLIGGKGPAKERLQGLIRARGLCGRVRMEGFISDELLPAYYQAADLFVLPSLALEGFGLVTAEALACGTPVVGTPVGAIPEVLGELEPRLIARGTDPRSLAECIDAFFSGCWSRRLCPQQLHDFVRDRYTWDRHVAATEDIYRQVAAA